MKFRIVALVTALALAACNQASAPAAKQEAAAASFPDLFQASYEVEATVRPPEGGDMAPIKMTRAGKKLRLEIASSRGPMTIIADPDANVAYMIGALGGRQMAMRVGLDQAQIPPELSDWASGRSITGGGPCAFAGENGTSWTVAPTEADPQPSTACVTPDGILLQLKKNDAVTWEATRVARGPQDAAKFAPPPGVQVIDAGALGGALGKL